MTIDEDVIRLLTGAVWELWDDQVQSRGIICLLSLLSLAPAIITALLLDINVLSSASSDLGVELPHPGVEVRRTRARATAARTLLGCRSLPTPSTQALYAIASRYITVFDTTLSGVYIIKHAFDYLVDSRSPTSPETRTWIVTVLNGLREREAVVTTLQTPSSPLGPGLISSQVVAPVERPVIAQPEDQVRPPYFSPALGESLQSGVLSIEILATSQAPSPADTIPIPSPLDPNAPTPLSDTTFSTVFSGRTAHNSPIRDLNHPIPIYSRSSHDHGPPTPNADSLVTKSSEANALGLFLSATSSKTVPSTDSLGRAKCDVGTKLVSSERLKKVLLKSGSINPVGWTGEPLDEVTTTLARGRAIITVPRFVDSAASTPSLSAHRGAPSSAIANSPAPTQSTAPTSIDLQNELEWETGTPAFIPCFTFQSPKEVQARDAEASVQEAPDDGKIEEAFAWWRNPCQSKDVRNARRNRNTPRKSRYHASESTTGEDRDWAKAEGKKPVGGRTPFVVTKPPSQTTLVASDTVDAEREEGSTDAENDLDEEGFLHESTGEGEGGVEEGNRYGVLWH
ncbi:hypothetical protein FS837_008817 [Tulasnella sp. UAMH 9824]|nr:hypothetical protein FS837_008817 [Tulasnella sp. UAMH 9824]